MCEHLREPLVPLPLDADKLVRQALGHLPAERPQAGESMRLFEAAFENTSIGKVIVRTDGRVFAANQALCDFLGYSKQEVAQISIETITHTEDLIKDLALFQELLAGTRESYQLEKRYLHKSGAEIWGLLHVAAIRDAGGQIEYVLSEVQDITARKRYETAWQIEKERLHRVESLARFGSWERENATGKLTWSEGVFRICGFAPAEGEPDHDVAWNLIHPEDRDWAQASIAESMQRHQEYQLEYRLQRPDGEVRHVLSHGRHVPAGNGRPDRLVGYLIDITALRGQRALLQESNRLLVSQNQQLEHLAHLASHNLRSPLANIQALAQLYPMSSLSERDEHMQLIHESALRALESLRQVHARIRQTKQLEQETRRIGFEPVCRRVQQLLEAEIQRLRAVIACDFAACPELDYVPLYLESIFLNLFSNALKFTRAGEPPHIRASSRLEFGHPVLEIRDNGVGLDLEQVGQRLFGLYQSFGDHPDSTGVGLYLVKSQVEACGGQIGVSSSPGQGATFTIRF